MKRLIFILFFFLALSVPAFSQSGTTLVTAHVVDTNGALYVNCQWSAVFVGENTTPGAGPYLPSAYTNGQQGNCDSQANFSVNLGDNINTMTPTPSQWNFSICSAGGYVGGPYCKANILITITGSTQDISSILTPLMPILPPTSGGGVGTITGVTAGSGLSGGGTSGNVTVTLSTLCAPAQVLQWTGSLWVCASVGTGNVNTAPVGTQPIVQPIGTTFSADVFSFIRYVNPSWNWLQTDVAGSIGNLSSPGSKTLTLTPCPKGMDTNSAANFYKYSVYISGVGTPEAVPVTGGSCAPGSASGTIIVTTVNPHSAGFSVGSASGGIQEAWNDAWTNDSGIAGTGNNAQSQSAPYVKLAAGTNYNVYSSVYLRGRGGVLDGMGALVVCSTRDRCIYIGTTQATPQVNFHKLYNLNMTSTLNVDGIQVSNASSTAGLNTITTNGSHNFVVGDTVDCEIYSQSYNAHFAGVAAFPTSGNTLTMQIGSTSNFAGGSYTFGFCNILNAAIEDNSDHVIINALNLFQSSPVGLGLFSYGVVNDNDQSLTIDNTGNRASIVLKNSVNWPLGAFVYERNDQGNNGITYLAHAEITNLNCGTAGGNGFVVSDSVCQGFPVYGFRYFGGLQPATFTNVYQESTGSTINPLYGYAAQMGYLVQARDTSFVGTFPANGFYPNFPCSGGSAGGPLNYWVVPKNGASFAAMEYIGSASNTGSGCTVNVTWPAAFATGVTPTYDILRTSGTAGTPPFGTGNFLISTGGTGVTCASSGMCSFSDTQAAATSYTVATQGTVVNTWFLPSTIDIYANGSAILTTTFDGSGITSMDGIAVPSVIANKCKSAGATYIGSPLWILCWSSDNNAQGGAGTITSLIQQSDGSGGPAANSKGRFNFGKVVTAPNDIITIQDSNFPKTVTTIGHRPQNDASDIALGIDTSTGLNIRAPSTISFNIGSIPTGSNWSARLSSSLFSTTTAINSSVGYQLAGAAPSGHCLVGNGTNYIDSSSCGGGTTVNVNGSSVSNPNFNLATPAAGTNGKNVTWQVSGSSVSAELVGDGSSNCLSGVGTYVACSGGLSGLTTGQRAVPNSSTTIATSGPTFYTDKLPGATWDARLFYCVNNAAALNGGSGYCDMSAETANPSSSTAANGVIANNGVIVILPPVTLSFASTFFFSITGNGSGYTCAQQWACILDASNNGSAGTIKLAGTGDFTQNVKMIGGRLNKQSGSEIVITGTGDWFWSNWIVNAGQGAINLTAANQSSILYNVIDQSGSAAILANNNSNGTTTSYNDIGFNLTRDANVNFGQNQQGTIGVGCSATNCAATPPTAHLSDYNQIHDNIILNQYFAVGDCNNPNFGTLNIASWSGSGTSSITFTYTTAQPVGGLPVIGQSITGATFAVGGLNATATVTASTTTTITATYGGTVTGSTGTGTITYTPTSSDTGCSEGIQTTDSVWYTKIYNNQIYRTSKEGIAFDGIGLQVTGNYCESCGLHVINSVTAGPYAWEKSTSVQASPGYVGDTIIANNVATNTTSTQLRYCIQNQWNNAAGSPAAPYTAQDYLISGNICDGTGGSGGFLNGITLNTSGLTGGNITLNNFRIVGNTMAGVTTPFNPNGYALITGAARLIGNGLNASTDTAPASGNVVCFDTNLQPELDCGTSGTNILTGVTTGGGLALSGHNVGIIQTCTTNQVMVWSGTAWICGPGVATGTTNAAVIYTSNTTIGATNVPTANGNYILSASVTTSASAAPGLNLPGVPFDVESGSTPAVTGSSSGSTSPNTTRASVFQMTNNTTSTGATIAAAGSAGFTSNYTFAPMNTGTVIATLTPSTSTVNGNATMKFVAKVAGHNPEGALIYSDNTNYWGLEILPTDANGFLAAEGFNVATSCTTCVVASSPGAGIAHFAGSTQTVTSSAVSLTADVSGVLPLANMTQLFQTNAQTATYQTLVTDFADCKTIPVASGTFTITMVASGTQPASGQCIDIINYGSGVVTVARSGQNLNGGTTSLTIPAGSASAANGMHIVSDGTNYIAQPWTIGAGVTSVNTLTGAVAIEAATAGQVAISGGASSALTGAADLTYATHTFSGISTTIFDLSAATGTAAFKLPTTTTNTASAAGVLTYDSTNSNYHANSGADSLVGVVPTASIPTNGHIIDASVASSKLLLHDSGLVTANVVTAASAATATSQTCVSSGSSKTCTYIDFPERFYIPSANCNNTTAGAGWNIGSGGVVVCRAGTNNFGGAIQITDTSSTFAQTPAITIPVDWDTATNPYIKFYFSVSTDTTNGHTVIPQIKVSCPTAGNGTVSDDATLSAAQSSSTVTLGASAVANGFYNGSSVQIGSTQMTGCIAGGIMIVQIGRATDTVTGNVNFYGVDITFPRLLAVQAN